MGKEFIWDSTGALILSMYFYNRGCVISGWINTLIYPHMDHVSDLWKIRGINLICPLSSVLIFKMLKQNNINKFHALAIVIFYLLPFAHCHTLKLHHPR